MGGVEGGEPLAREVKADGLGSFEGGDGLACEAVVSACDEKKAGLGSVKGGGALAP